MLLKSFALLILIQTIQNIKLKYCYDLKEQALYVNKQILRNLKEFIGRIFRLTCHTVRQIYNYYVRIRKEECVVMNKNMLSSLIKGIRGNIYAELLCWLSLCVVLALGSGVLSIVALEYTGLAKVEHVDYSYERAIRTNDIMATISSLYDLGRLSDPYEFLEKKIKKIDGECYLTDEKGNVIIGTIDEYLDGVSVNIHKWKALVRAGDKHDKGELIGIYPIMVNGAVHYWLVRESLNGVKTYTNEIVYIIGGCVALLLFLLLAFIGIRRKVFYLRYIGKCMKETSEGNLTSDIEVHGEDELAVIALNMNEMQKNIREKLETEKCLYEENNELITNMSHDLKTPLTVILGYLDIMNKKQYASDAERDSYTKIAYDKAVSLHEMVLRLFSFVKDSKTKKQWNRTEVNVSRYIRQVAMEYEQAAKEKELSLIYMIPDDDIHMMIDIESMKSVMDNLLGNALKYSREHGNITIGMEDETNTIHIMVSNDCLPIPVGELDKLFDKFYRADKARNSDIPGNGIGLAIVKEKIEEHNGKVWAEWEDGMIYFHIRLPK